MDNHKKADLLTEDAPAKINLALDIAGTRADGYHQMDMINHSCTLKDTLTLIPDETYTLSVNGKEQEDAEDNLVTRAVRLFEKTFLKKADFRVELSKRIPSRAGLGGGSADAAAMMRLLNRHWKLNLTDETLRELGVRLGADVPYCVGYGLCRVTGIGEGIEPAKSSVSLPPHLIVMRPPVGVSTPEAFRLADREGNHVHPDIGTLWSALQEGKHVRDEALGMNSFYGPVGEKVPELREAVDALLEEGADLSLLSGSGSAVVGYFSDRARRDDALKKLSGRFGDSFLAQAEIEI